MTPRRDAAPPREAVPAGDLLAAAAARLTAAGIEAARREARLLLAEVLACDAQQLFNRSDSPVTAEQAAGFRRLLERRLAGEPLSRLRGWREFWSLPFAVSPATLDPRGDSETLIEAVLARLAEREAPLRFLDLGTGSGCLLLALLSEYPGAWGLGVDVSAAAVAVAADNATHLALDDRAAFLCSDWTAALASSADHPWDLILSNPPYIASAEIPTLEPGVRDYDPRLALEGGADGLACFRSLIGQAATLLAPEGLLVLEIGHDQSKAVSALLKISGFGAQEVIQDLAGRDRCMVSRR